jgi:hypothetical protein
VIAFNVQASRNQVSAGYRSSSQLPQFDILASSPEEAIAKAREILPDLRPLAWHVGAVTDGGNVWDLSTGRMLGGDHG